MPFHSNPYQPLREPLSQQLTLNNHQYHIRIWPKVQAPTLFMLHGWMDCADTFQFVVDQLPDWQIIAPDWRGFGQSAWNSGSYYSPDYLADLDALLEHYSPDEPAILCGHSMGAMVAGLYAGIRPERIARLALLDGFGLSDCQAALAPSRYARWLNEKRHQAVFRRYRTPEEFAAKLQVKNPGMPASHAGFMARQLLTETADGWEQRADPKHKMVNPVLYRLEEAMACWRRICCEVLWVMAEHRHEHPLTQQVYETLPQRRACFKRLQETTLPDCGHMLQWEQAARLAAVLDSFFSTDQSPARQTEQRESP